MKGIADTGFVVAFLRCNDSHHDWAVGLAEQITEPLLTCEAVLSEAASHSVVTVDRADFSVYRRNKREAIALICPPI